MNRPAEYFAPPQFDPLDDPIRAELRAKLGLAPFLKQREAFRIGPDGIHCEYYHHADSAPLILFLPGIGTYCELYAELLASLSAKGFNVVGVDPRGHGYSDGRRGEYTVEQSICDLERVVTALQPRSNGRVGVYGYSIGAMLAVALAERDERISAVLCGTLLLTEVPPDILHQFGWFWTWGTAQVFPSLRLPLRSFIDYDALLAGNPAGEAINDDHRVVFDYPLRTLSSLFTHRAGVTKQRYDFRAAIIQGEHDEVLPLDYTQRVLAALEHPFELLAVPGEGHMIPWDNPRRLTALTADWFQRALD
ncbi:hypothetical protein GCM10011352_38770 [Marinobacterium zhoushanense]|uniref:Serine aminopeptidase S33 domain-containing protein n=1 Tax=Marinobacterium zhoushanense TaxID=1679163 RepID=A0ABQ1KSC0_9GAMM|nr:alpha/beta fold hydrolase [Marinobacterium zhoushanense]GGC08686.1 hypothetical protein GCM10011352_38770 [Marinobacterium zhoushanense]